MSRNIMIVEHKNVDLNKIVQHLMALGYKTNEIIHYSSLDQALKASATDPELIFVNAALPGNNGRCPVALLNAQYTHIPILVLADHADEKLATDAIKNGAQDYLVKDEIDHRLLKKAIEYSIERKRFINTMDTAQDDYRSYFMMNPAPMWIFDDETLQFLAVNNAALEKYGYTRAEFLQLKITDIRPAEYKTAVVDIMDKLGDTKYHDSGYWQHKKKNGAVFYVHVFSHPTSYQGRKARFVFALDVDLKVKTEDSNKQLLTKLQSTENALKEKIEEMESILSAIDQVVWRTRADTFELTYTNDACFKVYGYTPEEMIADKNIFFNAIYPEDRPRFYEEMKILMEAGKVESEFRVVHKDGGIHYLSGMAKLERGKHGEPDTCSGFTLDITNLKLAELALKEKADQLERVLDSISDGFFSLDNNWNFTYVNKEFERLYNISRDEIIGVNYWTRFPRAMNQKFYTEYKRALEERINIHFEEYASSLDRWVAVSVYPAQNGLTVYFTDITEQKKLQDKILLDEQNLRAMINNTKDAIWSVDRELKIISLNTAYQELIRRAAGIVPETGSYILWETLPEEFLKERKADYERALNGETFTKIDRTIFTTGEFFRETNFNPIIDADGNIIGVSCFSRDISEERRYLMKIEEQNKILRDISWVQSHKVRGPVANILGLSQLFNYSDPTDSVNKEVLEGLKVATTELDEIIKDVVSKSISVGIEYKA